MGAKMRTRPMAKWAAKGNESPGSRKSRREYSKSIARKGYQTQTRGAANRARKSVAGKDRSSFTYVDAQYERHLESTREEQWHEQVRRNEAFLYRG